MAPLSPRSPNAKWYCERVAASVRSSSGATEVDSSSVHGPLLPGSDTIPGYYGSPHSYDYQGPYYGGPYVSYWNRLPYACGVYGYC